ncbi:MAG: TonB-dependent receptor, partial [Bacteroidetes bacterium]|nr:TonB-dependent receptor [Bacteroidota bacterium]
GEAVLKSTQKSNYSWLFGLNGFGQRINMSAPVSFREDGIRTILQPVFTKIGQASGMTMTVKNPTLDIPGTYDTNRSGGAMFHQSTFENILVDGLSLTLGARLDIEKVALDYNSNSYLDIEAKRGPMVIQQRSTAELVGTADTTFVEFLPKAALKYEWGRMNFVYGSVSRGYKTGGFNVQMISDLVRDKLQNTRPGAPAQETDVKQAVMYKPEQSWNYEAGIQNTFLDRKLRTSLTLFYMDIKGLQLTEFVASGAGRKLTNAGTAVSKGLEISADMKISPELNIGLNYGYAHASFSNYKQVETVNGQSVEVDYSGKFVPYAPQHTANVYLNYRKKLENLFVNEVYGTLSYSGIGKIYWQDSNEIFEDFYSLADAVVGVKKNAFGLELWGKNLLNTHYNVFYFESFGNKFFQQGKPLQVGARLILEI